MKLTILAFVLFSAILVQPCQAEDAVTPAWNKYLRKLPKAEQKVLKKGLRCHAFGGDKLEPTEQKQWEKLHCDSYRSEVEKLRSKNSSDSFFVDAFNCVEGNAGARGCPEE